MNGIVAVCTACARVLSSRIDAQLSSVFEIFSIVLSLLREATRGRDRNAGWQSRRTRVTGFTADIITRHPSSPHTVHAVRRGRLTSSPGKPAAPESPQKPPDDGEMTGG